VYEVLIFVSGLSILTLVVAVLYSKSIREAHQKYVEAKNAVDDMILSFNRQLKRQEEQLEVSTHKIDVLSTRTELVAERLEEQNKEVRALGDKGKLVTDVELMNIAKDVTGQNVDDKKLIELMRKLKRIFDPNNILNPGAVLPS